MTAVALMLAGLTLGVYSAGPAGWGLGCFIAVALFVYGYVRATQRPREIPRVWSGGRRADARNREDWR